MSGESTPLLAGSIPAFEKFMTGWETLRDRNPQLAKIINVGLDAAYKYYKKMDWTDAYVIAMGTDYAFLFRESKNSNLFCSS